MDFGVLYALLTINNGFGALYKTYSLLKFWWYKNALYFHTKSIQLKVVEHMYTA